MGKLGARGWLVALCLVAGVAEARAVAGVRMQDTVSVDGRELPLDHVELKRKFFFDIYVWGLYLERTPGSTEEAIAFQGPKRLQLTFKRGIKREQLADAFRGFLANSPSMRSPEMKRYAEQLVQSLRGVNKGESLVIAYTPTQGLVVSGEGSLGAQIPGKEFADVLFTAWLQENPIYEKD